MDSMSRNLTMFRHPLAELLDVFVVNNTAKDKRTR